MNKQFLIGFIGIFLLISIVSACAGTDTDYVKFNMPGCKDQTLANQCSATFPLFCLFKESDYNLVPRCPCGCIPPMICHKIDCVNNPSDELGGNCDCQQPPENLVCEDHSPELSNDCLNFMGACFTNYTDPETPKKCRKCPDTLIAEQLVDCSYYQGQETCEEDGCFLGKTGFGVSFYESAYVIVNYSCEWDVEANNNAGGCALGYNTIDDEGNKARCKTTQVLGKCVDDKAELTWTRKCFKIEGDVVTTTPSEEPTGGTTVINCGKAASPLPFFTSLNLILATAILSVYYLFLFGNSGKSGG